MNVLLRHKLEVWWDDLCANPFSLLFHFTSLNLCPLSFSFPLLITPKGHTWCATLAEIILTQIRTFFLIHQLFHSEHIISSYWALESLVHNIASTVIKIPRHCDSYKVQDNFWDIVAIHKVLLVACFKIKNIICTYIYTYTNRTSE